MEKTNFGPRTTTYQPSVPYNLHPQHPSPSPFKKIFGFPLQIYMISILRQEVIFSLETRGSNFLKSYSLRSGLDCSWTWLGVLGHRTTCTVYQGSKFRWLLGKGEGWSWGRCTRARSAGPDLALAVSVRVCPWRAGGPMGGRTQMFISAIVIQGFWNDLSYLVFLRAHNCLHT